MGLTKQFLRYAPAGICNIVASSWSNFVIVSKPNQKGPLCAVGACENVVVWDVRKGEKHLTLLSDDKYQATVVAKSPDKQHLAVGYKNGSVKIFDLMSSECVVTFNGHRSPVSCLNYDEDGLRLASGGMDTDVVVWDVVNESGLFRLKGHTSVVTQVRFLKDKDMLITSSKDTFIKFWDLQTQHCFKTIVEHATEVYDFVILKGSSIFITGSKDVHLNVWSLAFKETNALTDVVGEDGSVEPHTKLMRYDGASDDHHISNNGGDIEELDMIELIKLGTIERKGKGHLISMCVFDDMFFGCHGTDSKVEIFKVYSDEEKVKHEKKSEKKRRRKMMMKNQSEIEQPPNLNTKTDDNTTITDDNTITTTADNTITASENVVDSLYKKVGYFKLQHPVRTFNFIEIIGNVAKIIVMYRNNSFAKYDLDILTSVKRNAMATTIDNQSSTSSCLIGYGHHKEPRCVAFSSDNFSFLSGSNESIKVWNRSSLQCFRTIPCSAVSCCMFALEDRQALVGKKNGDIEMYEIASSELVECVRGHEASVNAVSLAPNKLGFVSGGSDRHIVFWDFEFNTEVENGLSKSLTLKMNRKVEVADEVLCLKYSSDQKYVVVGCLDRKAYVYFADTMKMLHTLYSHHLPITCIDVSMDMNLIATGSVDKDVKVWSMDFGECRKIIKVAHDDKITCLQFVPKTHLFFTCGRDGKLKKWDADSFQLVMTLEGHQAAVNYLSISPNGNHLVTCSEDMSIRLWVKTQEILVLDDEKEMVREKEEEDNIREDIQVPGEAIHEVGIAGKKTSYTLSSTETLCEALDLYNEEKGKYLEYRNACKQSSKKVAPPALHLLFQAYRVTTPEDYILEVIKKIKSSDVEECLLILPFTYIIQLVTLLAEFLNEGMEVELVSRCLFFILRIHAGQIISNQLFSSVLENIQDESLTHIKVMKDMLGYNLAGLKFLQQKIEEGNSLSIFADAIQRNKQKRKKKKALLVIKS